MADEAPLPEAKGASKGASKWVQSFVNISDPCATSSILPHIEANTLPNEATTTQPCDNKPFDRKSKALQSPAELSLDFRKSTFHARPKLFETVKRNVLSGNYEMCDCPGKEHNLANTECLFNIVVATKEIQPAVTFLYNEMTQPLIDDSVDNSIHKSAFKDEFNSPNSEDCGAEPFEPYGSDEIVLAKKLVTVKNDFHESSLPEPNKQTDQPIPSLERLEEQPQPDDISDSTFAPVKQSTTSKVNLIVEAPPSVEKGCFPGKVNPFFASGFIRNEICSPFVFSDPKLRPQTVQVFTAHTAEDKCPETTNNANLPQAANQTEQTAPSTIPNQSEQMPSAAATHSRDPRLARRRALVEDSTPIIPLESTVFLADPRIEKAKYKSRSTVVLVKTQFNCDKEVQPCGISKDLDLGTSASAIEEVKSSEEFPATLIPQPKPVALLSHAHKVNGCETCAQTSAGVEISANDLSSADIRGSHLSSKDNETTSATSNLEAVRVASDKSAPNQVIPPQNVPRIPCSAAVSRTSYKAPKRIHPSLQDKPLTSRPLVPILKNKEQTPHTENGVKETKMGVTTERVQVKAVPLQKIKDRVKDKLNTQPLPLSSASKEDRTKQPTKTVQNNPPSLVAALPLTKKDCNNSKSQVPASKSSLSKSTTLVQQNRELSKDVVKNNPSSGKAIKSSDNPISLNSSKLNAQKTNSKERSVTEKNISTSGASSLLKTLLDLEPPLDDTRSAPRRTSLEKEGKNVAPKVPHKSKPSSTTQDNVQQPSLSCSKDPKRQSAGDSKTTNKNKEKSTKSSAILKSTPEVSSKSSVPRSIDTQSHQSKKLLSKDVSSKKILSRRESEKENGNTSETSNSHKRKISEISGLEIKVKQAKKNSFANLKISSLLKGGADTLKPANTNMVVQYSGRSSRPCPKSKRRNSYEQDEDYEQPSDSDLNSDKEVSSESASSEGSESEDSDTARRRRSKRITRAERNRKKQSHSSESDSQESSDASSKKRNEKKNKKPEDKRAARKNGYRRIIIDPSSSSSSTSSSDSSVEKYPNKEKKKKKRLPSSEEEIPPPVRPLSPQPSTSGTQKHRAARVSSSSDSYKSCESQTPPSASTSNTRRNIPPLSPQPSTSGMQQNRAPSKIIPSTARPQANCEPEFDLSDEDIFENDASISNEMGTTPSVRDVFLAMKFPLSFNFLQSISSSNCFVVGSFLTQSPSQASKSTEIIEDITVPMDGVEEEQLSDIQDDDITVIPAPPKPAADVINLENDENQNPNAVNVEELPHTSSENVPQKEIEPETLAQETLDDHLMQESESAEQEQGLGAISSRELPNNIILQLPQDRTNLSENQRIPREMCSTDVEMSPVAENRQTSTEQIASTSRLVEGTHNDAAKVNVHKRKSQDNFQQFAQEQKKRKDMEKKQDERNKLQQERILEANARKAQFLKDQKKKQEEEARAKAEEESRKKIRDEEEAKRREKAAAKKREEEARQREEAVARKREEDATRKRKEEARQREEAAARKREEEEARQREEAAARKRKEEARQREEAAARKREEEEARQREEAAARKRKEEARQREEAAARKREEEATRKRKEEARQREEALKRDEEARQKVVQVRKSLEEAGKIVEEQNKIVEDASTVMEEMNKASEEICNNLEAQITAVEVVNEARQIIEEEISSVEDIQIIQEELGRQHDQGRNEEKERKTMEKVQNIIYEERKKEDQKMAENATKMAELKRLQRENENRRLLQLQQRKERDAAHDKNTRHPVERQCQEAGRSQQQQPPVELQLSRRALVDQIVEQAVGQNVWTNQQNQVLRPALQSFDQVQERQDSAPPQPPNRNTVLMSRGSREEIQRPPQVSAAPQQMRLENHTISQAMQAPTASTPQINVPHQRATTVGPLPQQNLTNQAHPGAGNNEHNSKRSDTIENDMKIATKYARRLVQFRVYDDHSTQKYFKVRLSQKLNHASIPVEKLKVILLKVNFEFLLWKSLPRKSEYWCDIVMITMLAVNVFKGGTMSGFYKIIDRSSMPQYLKTFLKKIETHTPYILKCQKVPSLPDMCATKKEKGDEHGVSQLDHFIDLIRQGKLTYTYIDVKRILFVPEVSDVILKMLLYAYVTEFDKGTLGVAVSHRRPPPPTYAQSASTSRGPPPLLPQTSQVVQHPPQPQTVSLPATSPNQSVTLRVNNGQQDDNIVVYTAGSYLNPGVQQPQVQQLPQIQHIPQVQQLPQMQQQFQVPVLFAPAVVATHQRQEIMTVEAPQNQGTSFISTTRVSTITQQVHNVPDASIQPHAMLQNASAGYQQAIQPTMQQQQQIPQQAMLPYGPSYAVAEQRAAAPSQSWQPQQVQTSHDPVQIQAFNEVENAVHKLSSVRQQQRMHQSTQVPFPSSHLNSQQTSWGQQQQWQMSRTREHYQTNDLQVQQQAYNQQGERFQRQEQLQFSQYQFQQQLPVHNQAPQHQLQPARYQDRNTEVVDMELGNTDDILNPNRPSTSSLRALPAPVPTPVRALPAPVPFIRLSKCKMCGKTMAAKIVCVSCGDFCSEECSRRHANHQYCINNIRMSDD